MQTSPAPDYEESWPKAGHILLLGLPSPTRSGPVSSNNQDCPVRLISIFSLNFTLTVLTKSSPVHRRPFGTLKTRFVILIKIETDPFALHIESWMMVETGRCQTRLTTALIPGCVQALDIEDVENVTLIMGSTELEVPYCCICDEVSQIVTKQGRFHMTNSY